jgi:membrane protein
MQKMEKYIDHLIKLGEKIAERAKKVSLPFFEGVPLYDVALFFWRSMERGSITTRASAIAFSFFIAFFPFIIFLFTLIPFIPIENFQNELLILIQDVVPPTTYETIENTVEDIIMQPRGDLLSFGFFCRIDIFNKRTCIDDERF